MKVPLIRPHLPQLEDIEPQLRDILKSGQLTNFGSYSKEFERQIGSYLGVKYALSVSNATMGLVLLLNMLPENSEVIVPSFTFLPTVHAILWNSLTPVFVDVDAAKFTISPAAIRRRITDRTSAILAVTSFGAPCDIEELEAIATEYKIKLLFDSAHALGSRHNGVNLGRFGDAEVFSLSATKLLPCGEGGLVTTNSEIVYRAILDRRNYGFKYRLHNSENLGLNGKFAEFNAILGLWGLKFLDERVIRRNEIARKYIHHLEKIPGLSFQKVNSMDLSTYKDFTILVQADKFGISKDKLMQRLKEKDIETASYFSPAIHHMIYFKEWDIDQTTLKNTNALEQCILSLPIYFSLTNDEFQYIIASIKHIYEEVN